ncbi:MAG TPA: hypothetical protein VHZ95_14305, partial [Polyangiales bacterium]|nr:hypothetical protein [Polyangiales bacterium]
MSELATASAESIAEPLATKAAAVEPTLTRKHPAAQVIAPCLVFFGMMGLWSFISRVVLDPDRRFLLPPPERVIANGLFNAIDFPEMIHALGSTAEVALVGLALSIVIGV